MILSIARVYHDKGSLKRKVSFIWSELACNMYHSMYHFLIKAVLGRENLMEGSCQLKLGIWTLNKYILNAKQSPFQLQKPHFSFQCFLIFKIQNMSVSKLLSKSTQAWKSCHVFTHSTCCCSIPCPPQVKRWWWSLKLFLANLCFWS